MDARKRRRNDNDGAGEPCRRFGALAVRKGLITLDELKDAVLEQIDDDVSGREHRLLGSILYDRGLITDSQIDTVLRDQKQSIS